MSDRIPPLTADAMKHVRDELRAAEAMAQNNARARAIVHAWEYAIQQSQPVTEADVEAVARAIASADRPSEFHPERFWKSWVGEARAAIRAMGHTVEGD